MKYYKAVNEDGLSFFPVLKKNKVDWVALIGEKYSLGEEDEWRNTVKKIREGETVVCTKHMLHGYADIQLAVDFGKRQVEEGKSFRIIEFEGRPVAELQGQMLLDVTPWDKETREKFTDPVKYGFRSVKVLREVLQDEWDCKSNEA